MPPAGADATQNTPLAPSVEKAYYRKCIELKRRLTEVEEANDAARLRKLRLNRAIMKMRLERAFLLEQLAKRVNNQNDEDKQQEMQDRSPSQPMYSSLGPNGENALDAYLAEHASRPSIRDTFDGMLVPYEERTSPAMRDNRPHLYPSFFQAQPFDAMRPRPGPLMNGLTHSTSAQSLAHIRASPAQVKRRNEQAQHKPAPSSYVTLLPAPHDVRERLIEPSQPPSVDFKSARER